MGRGLSSIVLACVFAASAAGAATAQECGPLKQVASLPATVKNGRILIPVGINGKEKTFLLDTAGAVSQISPSTLRELGLVATESGIRILDVSGNASNQAATVTLNLGQLTAPNTRLQVSAHDHAEEGFDGIIAANHMARYDVEIDPVGGKVNYFLTDHCPGKVVYWSASAITIIPFLFRDSHIRIDAKLNGKDIEAILDTGAQGTFIRAAEAKRLFGITDQAEGNVQVGEIGGKNVYERVFDSLELEGLVVGKSRLTILPDLVGSRDLNNQYETGTRVRRVDDLDTNHPAVVIGMNVISKLRIYMAFGEKKLYVTPPVRPAPVAAPAN